MSEPGTDRYIRVEITMEIPDEVEDEDEDDLAASLVAMFDKDLSPRSHINVDFVGDWPETPGQQDTGTKRSQ